MSSASSRQKVAPTTATMTKGTMWRGLRCPHLAFFCIHNHECPSILAHAAIFEKNLPLGKESMVKIKDKLIPEGGRAGAPSGVLAFGMS